ncbi:hypothetical protein SLNWT_1469 [Streptomyces albus]|uniref:Uncharacterized protein n=1 Tax=Streptomyces albus (strain ATCC 21838 / DSM 41398 / FERM P-419 / JCM 4703 / NBRC 107858) TaxID=1081613 RepID=A0A0B5ERF7_STRA4|nr:hypothetical protein SLNWT_1469 [Streptomyces albus]AOU76161.1 hypothetical protein SLNHY_1470 [Streptomyces albus]AYN31953.1 hypothetical protein DUI70_1449 [Streptomyces albus]
MSTGAPRAPGRGPLAPERAGLAGPPGVRGLGQGHGSSSSPAAHRRRLRLRSARRAGHRWRTPRPYNDASAGGSRVAGRSLS